MKGRMHDSGDCFGGGLRARIARTSVCVHIAGEYSTLGVVYSNIAEET